MKLEDEIKQTKPFTSEYHKLEVNLIFTFNWLIEQTHDRFRGAEITMQQYNILRILRGQYPNPCTILLLKERMLDKESDASRLVDRLAAKDLITKHICPNDRRKADVLISKKGLALLKTFDKYESVLEQSASLTAEEAQTLNTLLDKLRGS
jgi:DNA-binding MarR family transcriptional regulator